MPKAKCACMRCGPCGPLYTALFLCLYCLCRCCGGQPTEPPYALEGTCGNRVCETGETTQACSVDCASATTSDVRNSYRFSCGNGLCEFGEVCEPCRSPACRAGKASQNWTAIPAHCAADCGYCDRLLAGRALGQWQLALSYSAAAAESTGCQCSSAGWLCDAQAHVGLGHFRAGPLSHAYCYVRVNLSGEAAPRSQPCAASVHVFAAHQRDFSLEEVPVAKPEVFPWDYGAQAAQKLQGSQRISAWKPCGSTYHKGQALTFTLLSPCIDWKNVSMTVEFLWLPLQKGQAPRARTAPGGEPANPTPTAAQRAADAPARDTEPAGQLGDDTSSVLAYVSPVHMLTALGAVATLSYVALQLMRLFSIR